MNNVVLDASAILAMLNKEPGAEKITPELLSRATASAVNLAEVSRSLIRGQSLFSAGDRS
jgi:PIN domain nuclease of toxin-antitoxin system